jgi:CTP:molybdopterin cytidylyltransferase MocA
LNCQPILVVGGVHFNAIQEILQRLGVQTLENPEPDRGPFSSLQIGVSSLPLNVDGFFFTPVDHPAVHLETYQALLEHWNGDMGMAVRPRYEGKGGHPVLLGKEWMRIILDALPIDNMRKIMRMNSKRVVDVFVNDPGILINVDTPEEYKKLIDDE